MYRKLELQHDGHEGDPAALLYVRIMLGVRRSRLIDSCLCHIVSLFCRYHLRVEMSDTAYT